MTDAPVASTFDIADLFSGKAYPKTSVTVYLDEDAAFEIYENSKAAKKALFEENQEAAEAIQKRLEELTKRAESSKVTFHLTGVSRADRKAVLDKTLEEFPVQRNFLGQEIPDAKADDAHANRRWALHIERIERPDGSIRVTPTPEEIKVFRDNAPDLAVKQIEEAIIELTEGASQGFETVAQETGFLSQP